MKHFLTLIIFMILTYAVNGQVWFDAGIKGSYGPTFMYDQNVFDHGTYKHKLTAGSSVGGRLGVNLGYHSGFSFEYISSTGKQDFNLDGDVYNSFKWKHNDLLVLYRYSGNGAYVELGGEYSIMNDVELTTEDNPTEDVTDMFVDNYSSGVLGFGSYIMGGGLFTVNLGIRLHWAFQDMVSEAGKDANYPIIVDTLDDPSKKTLATAAQLQLEANYAFGRFAKPACHDRWRLILFQ